MPAWKRPVHIARTPACIGTYLAGQAGSRDAMEACATAPQILLANKDTCMLYNAQIS